MKNKIHLALLLIFTFIIGATTMAYATSGFQSHGRFEYKSNPSSATPDVIIDSADLDTIYTEVSTGRGQIATALNNTGYGKLSGSSYTANDSFTYLKEAVENQFEIPANGGSSETFYKTAEGELTTNKTLAADYDSGEDTATELSLANATSANLSAGTMAWDSNGDLIIGTGGDNKSLLQEIKNNPTRYDIHGTPRIKLLQSINLDGNHAANGGRGYLTLTYTLPVAGIIDNWRDLTTDNFAIEWHCSGRMQVDSGSSPAGTPNVRTTRSYDPSIGVLTVQWKYDAINMNSLYNMGVGMDVYAFY